MVVLGTNAERNHFPMKMDSRYEIERKISIKSLYELLIDCLSELRDRSTGAAGRFA